MNLFAPFIPSVKTLYWGLISSWRRFFSRRIRLLRTSSWSWLWRLTFAISTNALDDAEAVFYLTHDLHSMTSFVLGVWGKIVDPINIALFRWHVVLIRNTAFSLCSFISYIRGVSKAITPVQFRSFIVLIPITIVLFLRAHSSIIDITRLNFFRE